MSDNSFSFRDILVLEIFCLHRLLGDTSKGLWMCTHTLLSICVMFSDAVAFAKAYQRLMQSMQTRMSPVLYVKYVGTRLVDGTVLVFDAQEEDASKARSHELVLTFKASVSLCTFRKKPTKGLWFVCCFNMSNIAGC